MLLLQFVREDIKKDVFTPPPHWATRCILPFVCLCLRIYWAFSWQWATSCLFLYHFLCMCECPKSTTKSPETHHSCRLSLLISHPFHPQFFTYLTRRVKLIIVPWRDEWVCECFHVSGVIKLQMKGMRCWEWETLLKFLVGCQIVFPPLPPPIILHWDSLPPVIDMLLKYSSRPVTLAFPLWAQMDPLWERSLVWICEYVCSGGSSWDRKLYIVIILCYFILFIHYVSELDIVIFSVQNVLERYTYRFI